MTSARKTSVVGFLLYLFCYSQRGVWLLYYAHAVFLSPERANKSRALSKGLPGALLYTLCAERSP